jgi:AsmA protein
MKLILALLALIPALLFGAVLFLLDNPDLYRQQLNDAVKRETGFELNINGDISWRYWPPIAIKVSDIEIQPAGSDQPFLLLETAAVDLKLIPLLLGGELAIDGLTIDGLTLNAEVAADGKGNWQVADTATAAAEADSSDSSANLNLDIAHMNISNAIIRYHAPAADYVINLKSLATGAVRADETTFIEFDVSAEDTLAGLSSSFQGAGNITFSRQLDQYQFNQLAIKSLTRLPDLSDIQASMTLNGDADLSQSTANLQAGQIQPAGLQATIDLQTPQM